MENGICTDATGGVPSYCYAENAENECKANCTSLESCVGFEFDSTTELNYCMIFTSASNSCPPTYDIRPMVNFDYEENLVMSMNDLKGVPDYPSVNCYGKIKGKILIF